MLTKRVGIVAVSELSFSLVKQKLFYANPMEYGTRSVDYLAFYSLKPISAITHYGKVAEIESNVYYPEYFRTTPHWMKRKVPLRCFHLEWLKELPRPIGRTQKHNAVIRPVYASLEMLFKAKTLTDIFHPED